MDLRKVAISYPTSDHCNGRGQFDRGDTGMRVQWRTNAARCARQSVSKSPIGLGVSLCVQRFVNLTLIVTLFHSSDQQCNHVSFSESGHKSGSRSRVSGFDRSNCPSSAQNTHEKQKIKKRMDCEGGERAIEYQADGLEAEGLVELDSGEEEI